MPFVLQGVGGPHPWPRGQAPEPPGPSEFQIFSSMYAVP